MLINAKVAEKRQASLLALVSMLGVAPVLWNSSEAV
jgi:hypothetical protein